MVALIKAFIIPFVLATGAFIYARIAFKTLIDVRQIDRWRNVFLAVTFVAFFVPNYWIVLFAFSLVVLFMGAGEKFKPALYLVLLFAMPAAGKTVPGFAGIDNFLHLYPYNVLALLLLYPAMLFSREKRPKSGAGAMADFFFIGFSLLSVGLAFRDTSFTDGIRRSTEYLLTAVPQYLVFSRVNWTAERIRAATAAIVIPLFAFAGIGVAEVVLHWHFYAEAISNWNARIFVRYLGRSGLLRAYGGTFGPIAFGLFFVMAIPLAAAMMSSVKAKRLPMLGIGGLIAGLVSSLSRGPWVGGVAGLGVFVLTSRAAISNSMKLAIAGLVALAVLATTPQGRVIYDMLPFIGNVNEDTIDYRGQLWDIGWEVVMQKPFFGSDNFRNAPEMQALVQGQGIIDIVNSYLNVALERGLVGLTFFSGALLFSLFTLWSKIGLARRIAPEIAPYAQGYVAALAGVMVTIATTSSTAQISDVTWILCGICVGVARYLSATERELKNRPPAPIEPNPEPPPEKQPRPKKMTDIPAGKVPAHLRQYMKK